MKNPTDIKVRVCNRGKCVSNKAWSHYRRVDLPGIKHTTPQLEIQRPNDYINIPCPERQDIMLPSQSTIHKAKCMPPPVRHRKTSSSNTCHVGEREILRL